MRNLLVLSALHNQYKYNQLTGYNLKPDSERRNGTPTLIATKCTNGTQNYWYHDAEYSCKCMSCGWSYTSKNSFNRLTNTTVECPNCGYHHKKENTHFISEKKEDNQIPMCWELKIKQKDKTTLILEIRYDHNYHANNDSVADSMERFIFDLKNNKADWELWRVENWNRGKCLKKRIYTLLEHLDIGYIQDKLTLGRKSVFAYLLDNYEDDNKVSLEEAINVLKVHILDIRMNLLGKSKQSLNLKGRNDKTKLMDNLLNIAHKVRFWEAPALTFLGTKDADIIKWFEENQLNYKTNHEMESEVEKHMTISGGDAYLAYLAYFNIPDLKEMRDRFTFRNIGLYKILERRYQNNRIVNLLFAALYNAPGKCVNKSYGYSSQEKKKSCIELTLDVFDQSADEIMKLSDSFIQKTVESIKYKIINISKFMPEYKDRVRERNYGSQNINNLIVNFASSAVKQATFEENIRTKALEEKKTEIQVCAEILKVPNNPIFRKFYDYDYKDCIQEVYQKFSIKTANEFLKVFGDEKINFSNEGASYTTFSIYQGQYRKQPTKKQTLEEYLKTIIKFYEFFSPIYPDIVTPSYAAKYVKKEDNYAVDSVIMIQQLNDEFKKKFLTVKPRMKDIHNVLCDFINKQRYPEINYNIPEDVINRFEMYCNNSKIKVLKKYSELLSAGKLMHNCSSSYRDRINQNHLLVVYTNNFGKPLAELEIKDNAIVQAKLVNNVQVKTNHEINNEILKFAKKTKLDIKTQDIEEIVEENSLTQIA